MNTQNSSQNQHWINYGQEYQVLKLYIWQKDALTVFFFSKKNKKAQRKFFSERSIV